MMFNKNWGFDRPGRALFWFVAAVCVLWSVQCALFQSVLGKDILETVMWGSMWQLGHLKHPPLSGWIGYLAAAGSGYSDFFMYLMAQLSQAFGVYFVYRLAREFLNETESAASALLLYALFYYNPSSMKFCSHFLEVAFMPPMVYYIVRGAKYDRITDWLLAGFFSALAVLGKYSGMIVLPGCLIYILWDKDRRKCFLRPGIWLGMFLGALMLLPHLIWLIDNDFACLRHVERRIGDDERPWYYFIEVIGIGIAPVAMTLLALLLAWLPGRKGDSGRKGLAAAPGSREVRMLSLLLTATPILAMTAIVICGGDVVMMWYSFLASWSGLLAVVLFPREISRDLFRNLWLLICLYTLLVFIGTTVDIVVKPRLRCHADTEQLIQDVRTFCRSNVSGTVPPVVIGERWLAGVIQFYAPEHPQACDEDDHISIALVREKAEREGALLVGNARRLRKQLPPEMTEGVNFVSLKIKYKAPAGKEKFRVCSIGYYPGRKTDKTLPVLRGTAATDDQKIE